MHTYYLYSYSCNQQNSYIKASNIGLTIAPHIIVIALKFQLCNSVSCHPFLLKN